MKGRHRRESERHRDSRDWQGSKERRWAEDQPWREERHRRYPDEPYGGERERRSAPDERQSYRERRSGASSWGRGYGYGFGDSGDYRAEQPTDRGWENYPTAGFGFGAAADVEGRGSYGYGSPYGQGDMGTDRAGRGDWRDTDWAPNRPARGRGTWAGDWSTGGPRGGIDYSGRAPRDYRRSDDRIREDICDRFTDDPALDPSDVVVKVENGDVTLMGSVTTRDQKRRAEDVAECVGGVRDVINQLRVMRGETTAGAPVQGASRTARASSPGQSPSVAADRDRER